jgi:hypothetical protein
MLDRPMICTNILTSIERISKHRANIDLLSIGPAPRLKLLACGRPAFRRAGRFGRYKSGASLLLAVGCCELSTRLMPPRHCAATRPHNRHKPQRAPFKNAIKGIE